MSWRSRKSYLYLVCHDDTGTEMIADFLSSVGVEIAKSNVDDFAFSAQSVQMSDGCQIAFVTVVIPVEL